MLIRFFGHTADSSCVVASHAILACSGLGDVFLNCGVVFGDGPSGDDPAEGRLREFVDHIRGRGAGGYVCLSEAVQRRLAPLARELGLERLPTIPLMARSSVSKPGEEGTVGDDGAGRKCSVEQVTTVEGLADFLWVSERAFELPGHLYQRVVTPALLEDDGLSVYVCRLDGRPVACACVVEDEGVAGISGMATVPELQRRGLGGQLLTHVLRTHAERARAFYLTASEAGRSFYPRYGFKVVDSATAWVVSPPDD